MLKILKPFNSEFFKDYKIWLVLIIKWEFDYLCRKLLNPKILDASIKKYTSLTRVIINLASNNWLYETKILKKKLMSGPELINLLISCGQETQKENIIISRKKLSHQE